MLNLNFNTASFLTNTISNQDSMPVRSNMIQPLDPSISSNSMNMSGIMNSSYSNYLTPYANKSNINKSSDLPTIPLYIYQTWNTLRLPPGMAQNVMHLKNRNPEFKYQLFDDAMCYNFIKNNFGKDVLYAFNKLKPGAYKADLWRYCVLYKTGGMYLDIKLKCLGNFKLIDLIKDEYWVRDKPRKHAGIYQAFMICRPKNKALLHCIHAIVNYAKFDCLGGGPLSVTGPNLLSTFVSPKYNDITRLQLQGFLNNHLHIYDAYLNKPILGIYNRYRHEQKITNALPHYSILWKFKEIYNYPILKHISCNKITTSNHHRLLHTANHNMKTHFLLRTHHVYNFFSEKLKSQLRNDRCVSVSKTPDSIWIVCYRAMTAKILNPKYFFIRIDNYSTPKSCNISYSESFVLCKSMYLNRGRISAICYDAMMKDDMLCLSWKFARNCYVSKYSPEYITQYMTWWNIHDTPNILKEFV